MLFPTLDYIFFLPIVVGLFWAIPKRYRLFVIALASLFFYGSWSPKYLILLVGVSLISWAFGMFLHKNTASKKTMALIIFILFIPLLVFKYTEWGIENLNILFAFLSLDASIKPIDLALPIGISFFSFQAVAYVVDVYRDKKHSDNPIEFFSFLAFFPQLVAGPIIRRDELLPQLKNLQFLNKGMASEGIYRIIKGMLKKLLIADVIARYLVNAPFEDPTTYTSLELWIAIYSYTIQIYYDFSAYTDIAIGSALLFGIRLPENFFRPYKATSVAEFWRRWHRTLSNWIRDYIYYPLGGSQVSSVWRVYLNIMITLVVIGIWHGASWNFVVYGFLHGTAVCVNRWQRKRTGRKAGMPFTNWFSWFWRFLLTFHFIVLARILFRAEDLSNAWFYFENLWFNSASPFGLRISNVFDPSYVWLSLLGFAIHFTPESWEKRIREEFANFRPLTQALIAATVALICIWWLGNNDNASTFIYYEF